MNAIAVAGAAENDHSPHSSDRGVGRLLRSVSAYALYAALLAPLLVPPSLIYPSTVFPAVFFRWTVAIASVGLLWEVIVRRNPLLARDAVFLSLLVFLAAATGSALLGYAPTRSLYGGIARMGGVVSILYSTLFYACLRTFIQPTRWKTYLRCAFMVGCLIAVVAILQSIVPGRQLLWIPRPAGNPAGTLPNSGLLGGYLLVILGVGAWLFVKAASGAERLVTAAGIVLAFYAFLLPANRASFLGLLAALALGALVAAIRSSARTIRLAILSLVAGLVGVVVITFLAPSNPLTQAVPPLRSLSEINLQHPTLVVRFDYWRAALSGFASAPLLGAGPENFGVVFTRFHTGDVFESLASGYEDRSHNIFVEVLSTTGVIGTIAYVGIWMSLALGLIRAFRGRLIGFTEAAVIAGLGISFLLYLQMWFHELTTTIPLIALAAYVGFTAESREEFDDPAQPIPERSRALLAVFGALVLGFFTYQHTVPVVQGASVLASTVLAPTFEEGAASLQGSEAQRTPETMEVATIDATALLELTREMGAVRADPVRLETVQRAVADADAQLERLNRLDPMNDLWFIERGDIYVFAAQLTGEREYVDLALEHYATAAKLSPRRLTPLYKASAAQLLIGDRMAAFATVDAAKRLDPREGRPWAFETRIHLGSGNYQAARASLRQAWARDHCSTHSEIEELLRADSGSASWSGTADLLDDFYSLECSEQLRTPGELGMDRLLRMAYPLALLRAGRESDAVAASETVLLRVGSAKALLDRFARDVDAGWGDAWARHRSLISAGREFGAGPLAVGEVR